MTVSIFAGAVTELRFDPTTKDFAPAANVATGFVFGVRQLDFWQAQCLYDSSLSEVERVRAILGHGLTTVDGSTDLAAQFVASPAAQIVNPLVAKIVAIALGN